MPRNPVFSYTGPGGATIEVGLILFDGRRVATRGSFVRTPVTSGSAADPSALSGISAWADVPFSIDVADIEFLAPDIDGAGLSRAQRYRCLRAQRSHGVTYWTTTQFVLADEPVGVAGPFDWKRGDWAAGDWA